MSQSDKILNRAYSIFEEYHGPEKKLVEKTGKSWTGETISIKEWEDAFPSIPEPDSGVVTITYDKLRKLIKSRENLAWAKGVIDFLSAEETDKRRNKK